jgi:prepilin-type N-terminal cleavage/methylation domain-containing protein
MRQQRGFTLVELAISMVILGLVLTGFALALSQQVQQRQLTDTRTALQQANDAIVAFVVANGRLPCPALVGSSGQESMAGIGKCTAAAGFLPAVSLGLPNLDGNGLLNDGWADGSTNDNAGVLDYPRAIRYSVALLLGTAQQYALTTASLGGAARQTVGLTLAAPANNGLFVCRSSAGIVAAGNRCGGNANALALNVVAVIWSQGPTGNDALGNSADEKQNSSQLGAPAVPRTLIMRDPSGAAAAAGRFDDVVSWVSWGTVSDQLMLAWQVQ